MFCCVFNLNGEPVSPAVKERYSTRIRTLANGDAVEEVDAGAFVAWVVPSRSPLRPLWARRCGKVAIGSVRLDNPEEVQAWSGTMERHLSSLEMLLDAYGARGQRCVRDLLGDFSAVIYDEDSHLVLAGRDAIGVKTLFIAERAQTLILSSHVEAVHDDDALDEEFVADFLLGGDPGPDRTIWADSRALPQGSILIRGGERNANIRFWAPHDFVVTSNVNESEQVEQFRWLFAEAIRTRLAQGQNIWAELSGGLDSSSVVCMAEYLRVTGSTGATIAGTLTLADELGEGDERAYSQLVVRKYGLRNELLLNSWPWCDDGCEPPRTDEPRAHYPFFARDRAAGNLVRRAGGTVLLGGWGADHYLYGSKLFMADALALGKVSEALRLVSGWSIAERKSFWNTLVSSALVPLFPGPARRFFAPAWDRVPRWIDARFARRTSLADRLASARSSEVPRGRQFEREVANNVQELTRWLPRGSEEYAIESRYPFLSRPLIELGLQLPPTMRVRPLAQKWILRQAMAGVLPDPIRLRPGKGGIDARLLWALSRERRRLDDILRASALAAGGIVDVGKLRHAVEEARQGRIPTTVTLLCALGLDTWLYVRSGRWTVRGTGDPGWRVTAPKRLAALKGGET